MSIYNRWDLDPEDLKDITALKARDLIMKCFYEAQRETFRRGEEGLGKPSDDDSIQQRIASVVRIAFTETHGDFDVPTKESLSSALGFLAKMSASWGTPEDIIEYHTKQIQQVLESLP